MDDHEFASSKHWLSVVDSKRWPANPPILKSSEPRPCARMESATTKEEMTRTCSSAMQVTRPSITPKEELAPTVSELLSIARLTAA